MPKYVVEVAFTVDAEDEDAAFSKVMSRSLYWHGADLEEITDVYEHEDEELDFEHMRGG
jgi:hypothetical protein